jgi:hypothetical protein
MREITPRGRSRRDAACSLCADALLAHAGADSRDPAWLYLYQSNDEVDAWRKLSSLMS